MSEARNIIWSPKDYAETAVVAREAGEEMLSRLDWMTLKPAVILDVACGVGDLSALLKERYPDAAVLSLDMTLPMLQHTRSVGSICGNAETLPLPNQSVDFIFANFLLPWYEGDLNQLLQEWKRVLRPEGLLMLTALGPDTLRECHGLFEPIAFPRVIDMHDLGDVMLKMGWSDPVLDVCQYTTTYRDKEKLLNELCASGMLVAEPTIHSIASLMPSEEGVYEITYEVIHAHAFKVVPKLKNEDKVVKVPISSIVKPTSK